MIVKVEMLMEISDDSLEEIKKTGASCGVFVRFGKLS